MRTEYRNSRPWQPQLLELFLCLVRHDSFAYEYKQCLYQINIMIMIHDCLMWLFLHYHIFENKWNFHWKKFIIPNFLYKIFVNSKRFFLFHLKFEIPFYIFFKISICMLLIIPTFLLKFYENVVRIIQTFEYSMTL